MRMSNLRFAVSHDKHLPLACAAQTDVVFVKNRSRKKTWLRAASTVRSSASQAAGFQELVSSCRQVNRRPPPLRLNTSQKRLSGKEVKGLKSREAVKVPADHI